MSTTLLEYQKFCKSIAHSSDKELLNWGLGIAGEAGDVASCIKKTVFHDNDQKEGIKENLGDTLWYAAMICDYFGWNLHEVIEENVEKLKKRFPKGHFRKEDAKRKGEKIDWNEL